MLTYQVRPRIYRHPQGKNFSFPNDVEIVFHFQPLQPFGKEASGGRTAVRAVGATSCFDANTGRHWIQSKKPLEPLQVVIEKPDGRIEMHGNELHVQGRFESLTEMDRTVQSLFFAFPVLLNIEFADPPVVERVSGKVGDVPFRWELDRWRMEYHTTTQELQQQRIGRSWDRLDVLAKSRNQRVAAALHYFHVACRLCRAGNFPWEFMSEIILNLSKVLEVMFPPPTADGGTLDAARSGLKGLGYLDAEIEEHFIPAMALRNHIDSAHVDLSVFTRQQRRILHAYTELAESAFRKMLRRLVTQTQAGQYTPVHHDKPCARPDAVRIIERMAEHCVGLGDPDDQSADV